MDTTQVVDLARQAVMLLLVVAGPVLLVGMVVGVTVSLIQAVTQVQEQTLSFVPKIFAMLITAVMIGPWAATKLIAFARQMLGSMP